MYVYQFPSVRKTDHTLHACHCEMFLLCLVPFSRICLKKNPECKFFSILVTSMDGPFILFVLLCLTLMNLVNGQSYPRITLPSVSFLKSSRWHSLSDSLACATVCIDKFLNTIDCSPIDNHCYCSNDGWVKDVGKCICSVCSGTDIQTAALVASQLCLLAVRVLCRLLYFTTSRITFSGCNSPTR